MLPHRNGLQLLGREESLPLMRYLSHPSLLSGS